MRKVLLLTAAFAMVATASFAATPAGKLGIGFMRIEAPVGVRVMLNEKVSADIGVGFANTDLGETSRTDFNVNAALPISVIPTDKANFSVVPGVLLMSRGGVGDASGTTDFQIYAALEVEFFLSPAFAVNASHGLAISITDQGETTATNFGTFGRNWTNFGFHFYIPSK